MSNARWRKVKEDLKASSSHNFERSLLPYLRIRWPDLAHPKSLGYLDKSGVDQVLVGEGNPISVVVQCKGFEIQEPLGKSQIGQIKKSINSFLASKHTCSTYIVVYNRVGEDQTFATSVRAELLRVRAEVELSHRADRELIRGWGPTG